MKVVHLAVTPLSGSPMRIVRALNVHTPIEADLVTTKPGVYGKHIFDCGLSWSGEREEALDKISKADCLHLHNFNDIGRFDHLLKDLTVLKGKPKVVQFHSCPYHIDYEENKNVAEVVIAQYPERYYPRARVVPNVLGIGGGSYLPGEGRLPAAQQVQVFFAPSMPFSSWKIPKKMGRWSTKGAREVLSDLRRVEARSQGKMACVYRTKVPHDICMAEKRMCHVAIDDLVTGSYHLAGLEALAQGLVTLGYLDRRTQRVLKEITGASTSPWVDCRVESLPTVLEALLESPERVEFLGTQSRAWMERYYSDACLVEHYRGLYQDLFEDPSRIKKQRFSSNEKKAFWHMRGVEDARYKSRVRRGNDVLCSDPTIEFGKEIFGTERTPGNPLDAWFYKERGRRTEGGSSFVDAARRRSMRSKYAFAASFVEGKDVLQLGCGTGYGAVQMKEEGGAKSSLGVDSDKLAIIYAKQMKRDQKASFVWADALNSRLKDVSFDVVVAMDLIEQVDCDGALLDVCSRLLKKGGKLILSSGDFWDRSIEVWQLRYYRPKAMRLLLKSFFERVEVYRQIPDRESNGFSIIPEVPHSGPLAGKESLIFVCEL